MRLFFKQDEDGFTTVGAAVALLLVFALLFAGLQAYWVGSRSGQVQYVADSAALAADSAVAEYITYGQTVDAVLLTFSLTAIIVFAISAVAAFIPGGQGVAADLANVGQKILQLRNKFASGAEKGLKAAQAALPALCAVRAAQAVSANADASGIDYVGIAIPCPLQGEEIALSDGGKLDQAMQDVEDQEAEIEEEAAEQQEAQDAVDAAKYQGWLADCGSEGSYSCMRERAAALAGLSGSSNPAYSSVDTWSWSAALARAKAYYQARYNQETEQGTLEEAVKSVARKHYYAYALDTLNSQCQVTTTTCGEYPQFVALAHGEAEVKNTSMYTEDAYPVSVSGSTLTIHATKSCPAYQQQTAAGTASVADEENGAVQECSQCKFSVATLGAACALTVYQPTGFEYHYAKLVDAATACDSAMDTLQESSDKLKEQGEGVKDILSQALKDVAAKRYDPQPPGRYGCISIVYAGSSAGGATSSFVAGDGTIGTRMAISGATLAADPDTNQSNVISSLGSNLLPQDCIGQGLLKTAFGAWGGLLQAYTNGVDGISNAFKTVLGAIPVAGTAMSEWAADTFEGALEEVGLQPPDLKAYKPVLVNTSHILARDDGEVAQGILKLKQGAEVVGADASQTLGNLLGKLGIPSFDASDINAQGISIIDISLPDLGIGTGNMGMTLQAPDGFVSLYEQTITQMQQALGGG